ncbi:MAG: histidine phosphatase family protein [Proteobacteria bacterium]|nr:histidine phosphatase family protein [Pseudomonadota bacterium]
MQLLLIRHGETAANAERRVQGHLDVPLSDRGLEESELLARRVAALPVAAIYSSPLQRARQTADAIAGALSLEIEERDDLMERDVGALSGLVWDEVMERYPEFMRARAEPNPTIEVPGYELDDAFNLRVHNVLEAIIARHPEQTVAVVTHGGVIYSFCRQTLQIEAARPAAFDIGNGSITVFDVHDGEFDPLVRRRIRLMALNDTCHLDGLE